MSSSAGVSARVSSGQVGPHRQLAGLVERHLAYPYRRPIAAHTRAAFEALAPRVESAAKPLIFDAGCGTGQSTRALAERYPQALVIGIDKSAHRLAKAPPPRVSDNWLLVRAELADFWRLSLAAGWLPWRHYLLYPNPWPKARHVQRRWHGSPLLPTILALGGERLEVRSNWEVYVREFALALELAGITARVERYRTDEPLTPFERKYQVSGQALWRCIAATISTAAA